jgi:hypothetical protein
MDNALVPKDHLGQDIVFPAGSVIMYNVVEPQNRRVIYVNPNNQEAPYWVFSTVLRQYHSEQQELWVVVDPFFNFGATLMYVGDYERLDGQIPSLMVHGSVVHGIDAIARSSMGEFKQNMRYIGNRCALPGCGVAMVVDAATPSACSRCRAVQYCCREHQTVHWVQRHRLECRTLSESFKSANVPLLLPPDCTPSALPIDVIESHMRQINEKMLLQHTPAPGTEADPQN